MLLFGVLTFITERFNFLKIWCVDISSLYYDCLLINKGQCCGLGFRAVKLPFASSVFNVHALSLLTIKSPTAVVGVMQMYRSIRATLNFMGFT